MAIGFLVVLETDDVSVTMDSPMSIINITETDSKLGDDFRPLKMCNPDDGVPNNYDG